MQAPTSKEVLSWQARCAQGIQRHILCSGAKTTSILRLVNKHPLTDAANVHALSNSLYNTGAITMRDHQPRIEQVGKSARALFNIRRVYAGSGNFYQHFARTRLWRRLLTRYQRLRRRAKRFKPYSFHYTLQII